AAPAHAGAGPADAAARPRAAGAATDGTGRRRGPARATPPPPPPRSASCPWRGGDPRGRRRSRAALPGWWVASGPHDAGPQPQEEVLEHGRRHEVLLDREEHAQGEQRRP